MPTHEEAERRRFRQNILLSGDFGERFINPNRLVVIDLWEILEELQRLVTASYNADFDPLLDLNSYYPAFRWECHEKTDLEKSEDVLLRLVENSDYILLKDHDGPWTEGIITATAIEFRKRRFSICCGQVNPKLWGPLVTHKWVRITN
ncbi:MAG: hypothetical protein RL292_585 [Candidatus Parcubacteria bacterium]|jgi:hypothetical protein